MDDLKRIKKHYDENMMHLCRELFPKLLETEGLLYKTLSTTFNPSRFLYGDITRNHYEEQFQNTILSKIKLDEELQEKKKSSKTPEELLKEVGYTLYECKTEDDIQSFRKYYTKKEEICTFKGGRLRRCHVFFAVRDDAEELKREDFKEPKRQDKYGTSVISIQFSRGRMNNLSIKNRYNHTVKNADATFSNNLEEINEGLTSAFESKYDLNIDADQNITYSFPGYIMAKDGKYYKYNYEINNVYYCPDNVIIDNFEVKKYDKAKYIVIDYFIIDLQNKKISIYDEKIDDSFTYGLNNIKDIKIDKKNNQIIIDDNIIITINDKNEIIGYKNHNLKEIPDDYLSECKKIENIDVPNVKEIGDNFLKSCYKLKSINLPNVVEIGDNFLSHSIDITEIDLPKVKNIGNNFMFHNKRLTKITVPNLIKVGNSFLHLNTFLKRINLPSIEIIGNRFLFNNNGLVELILPNAKTIGNYFMPYNNTIKRIYLPETENISYEFLNNNKAVEVVYIPNAKSIGENFLGSANNIKEFNVGCLNDEEYIKVKK